MGCAHSSADDSKRNEEINKQLHDEQIKNNPKDVIKLLLLGNLQHYHYFYFYFYLCVYFNFYNLKVLGSLERAP